jgi:hypothetical protein
MEKKRREGIYRTKTGLLLLTIGIFLGLSNLLRFLRGTSVLGGTLLALILGLSVVVGIFSTIGAILVILGREVFGKAHSSRVLWSVGFFIGGNVISVISFFPFLFTLVETLRANSGGAGAQDALVSSFYILLIGQFIGASINGLAYVLVTYSLQRPLWHMVLWAAYVPVVALGLVSLIYYGPQVSTAVQSAFSGGTLNSVPTSSLQAQVADFSSLNSIPRTIYGVAYLLVSSRISRGEIPLAAASATSQ